jgi:drug/metabolite transporter (DMT)-like permease
MDERRPLDTLACATMVVLCALWGTQQVAVKLAASAMNPVLQIGLRSAIGSVPVLAFVVWRREIPALVARQYWKPGIVAGMLFGLEFVLIGEGLRFTSASHMSIFLYTAPIFAALALHLRLPSERLVPLQWIGIGIAFAGVVMAFAGRGGGVASSLMWLGDLLGVAAAVTWGATTVVIRTTRLSRAPASVALWYQLIGAAILGIGEAVALRQTAVSFTPVLAWSLAYQSFIVAALSYLAWFSLLRVYLATRLGVLSFMTPVFGIGFGVAILNESLTWTFVVGALLILAGILLVSGRDLIAGRRPHRTGAPPSEAGDARAPNVA